MVRKVKYCAECGEKEPTETVKQEKGNVYSFPKYGIVIKATSMEEAMKKFNNIKKVLNHKK